MKCGGNVVLLIVEVLLVIVVVAFAWAAVASASADLANCYATDVTFHGGKGKNVGLYFPPFFTPVQ